jgi:S-DNA-T family DNA segregation ATPase FtsK/SpoIIIE
MSRRPTSQAPDKNKRLAWGPRQAGLAGVLVSVLAVLTLLALLGATRGAWIDWWTHTLRWLFGWGAYVIAVLIGGVGYWLIRGRGGLEFLTWSSVIGFEIIFFCALGLLHTVVVAMGPDPWQLFNEQLGGGGFFGWGLMTFLNGGLRAPILTGLMLTLGIAGGAALMFHAQVRAVVTNWVGPLSVPKVAPRQAPLPEPPAPPPQPARTRTKPRPADQAELKNLATPEKKAKPPKRNRRLPPLDLLEQITAQDIDEEEIKKRAELIRETLKHFGLETNVIGYSVGPAVTQYAVEPGFIERPTADGAVRRQKVRVGQIASLANDLALALAAPSLRIEAPVPGQSYVGIEVPNPHISLVSLRGVMESSAFRKIAAKPLAIALGKDVSGQSVVADLAIMPHMLIAGTTGSGKSVCINALITCLVLNNQPEDLKLVMIDPKMVELVRWNGLPHLYGKVETDLERIVGVLRWVTREMDGRYKKFAQVGSRNLADYNSKMTGEAEGDKLPQIVVLIDELADLMMLAPVEVEKTICRIAQMARATGIHMVMATQRPSTDVVTGLIKANFPARISFAVASSVDSRVILDSVGAETLLGKGDMLFQSPDAGHPVRVQGCYASDREMDNIVKYWKEKMAAEEAQVEEAPWEPSLRQAAQASDSEPGEALDEADDEQLLQRAIELVRRQRGASASLLQRKMRIGYPKAARIIDQMEEMGIIGPPEAAGRLREVLLPPPNGGTNFRDE